jgi:hypothetical protein
VQRKSSWEGTRYTHGGPEFSGKRKTYIVSNGVKDSNLPGPLNLEVS